MGNPLNEDHSIESASFVLAYTQPFSKSAIESLTPLREVLGELLPSFQMQNAIGFTFDVTNGIPVPLSDGPSSLLMQKNSDDGTQEWGLRVEANYIMVTSFKYSRWNVVSKSAFEILASVSKILSSRDNPLTVMGLQVIDKFLTPPDVDYDIGDVFNRDSRFLTRQALESEKLWHVYQGWFDNDLIQNGRVLNVLNLSTNDTPDGLISTVDHNAQLQFSATSSRPSDISWLQANFDSLHEENKSVLRNLLSNKSIVSIKLN